ncbi:hypothetical protein ABMX90_14790 [Vibrio vulnificus]|uniref:hypothetical protein n=1 Tax=Vibrio vulnificus TaxID=672 RepID=UPI00285925D7|nr:hypothetical protein [Vibrio vulnificus]ELC9582579.1 hypothetical protein [Vibrio vulnificus]
MALSTQYIAVELNVEALTLSLLHKNFVNGKTVIWMCAIGSQLKRMRKREMLVIESEIEFKVVEQNLISFCEHPLYGVCPEHEQESQEMQDALKKWREDNPL